MLVSSMNIDDVQAIGQRLFGRRWRAPLARAIAIAPETVSRWLHQKQGISGASEKAILQLAAAPRYRQYREKRTQGRLRSVTMGHSRLVLGSANTVPLTQSMDVIVCDPFGNKPLSDVSYATEPMHDLQHFLQPLYTMLSAAGRLMMIIDANTDPRLLAVVPPTLAFNGRVVVGNRIVYCFAKVPGAFEIRSNTRPALSSVADISQLLTDYTTATDVLCDPFMGEGQLAEAATQLGRTYIGFESERRYWLSTRARLTPILTG